MHFQNLVTVSSKSISIEEFRLTQEYEILRYGINAISNGILTESEYNEKLYVWNSEEEEEAILVFKLTNSPITITSSEGESMGVRIHLTYQNYQLTYDEQNSKYVEEEIGGPADFIIRLTEQEFMELMTP